MLSWPPEGEVDQGCPAARGKWSATAHQEFHGVSRQKLNFHLRTFPLPRQGFGFAVPRDGTFPNVPSQKGCGPAPQSHHTFPMPRFGVALPLAGGRCVLRRGAAPRLPTASGVAVLVTGAPLLCALFLQEGGRAGLGGDSKGCRAVDYPSGCPRCGKHQKESVVKIIPLRTIDKLCPHGLIVGTHSPTAMGCVKFSRLTRGCWEQRAKNNVRLVGPPRDVRAC